MGKRVPSCIPDGKTFLVASHGFDQLTGHKNHRPRIFILDNADVSAIDLLSGDYDFVITTYGFVHSQWRKAEAMTGEASDTPLLPLHSELYKDLDAGFKHLVLDEVQAVKKFDGKRHKAIKSLFYKSVIMLSGTPFGNKWNDIFGIIDLLPNEPLIALTDYQRIFGGSNNQRAPTVTQKDRLVKYLMSFSFGRPGALLQLPPISRHEWQFKLNKFNADAVISQVDKFYQTVFLQDSENSGALSHIVRAQQMASSCVLLPQSQKPSAAMVAGVENLRSHFLAAVEAHSGKSVDQRPTWATDDISDENSKAYIRSFVEWQQEQQNKEDLPLPTSQDEGLVEESEDEDDDTNESIMVNWETVINGLSNEQLFSERIQAFLQLYRTITQTPLGAKVVVWSRFVRFLDLLDIALQRDRNVRALRFDGTLDSEERVKVLHEFGRPGLNTPLLITPGSCGAGLNLVAGTHVVFCEPWWNRQDVDQAERRCWRMGQMKPIEVWSLCATNSAVDQLITATATQKKNIIDAFMDDLKRRDDQAPSIPFIRPMYSGISI